MIKALIMTLLIISFVSAPAAAADPEDLVPSCSAGQAPQPGACSAGAEKIVEEATGEGFTIVGFFPGANPGVPPGPLPLDFPVVIPLGVTPFNIPSNLPLGPTPPTRLPFAP